ncbi:hypothetical protein PGUG_02632 [Meyerozyma guilliermondii ATCC 6260]|uniref:Rho-GAP domain-containing protein n=1 Tax=Meyerozyma guilliermondii (strain ATCC 6260 / CBS 566 / DSM 6381 / JCM 1539 / NBRC 10279 / NRRL Y-324) TaxID=294746 RepID=A5DH81_PICGU|nr:uncharacterized protein PGUG_02632 [Meyerozyma guilliermondii ATCC 6260]EDK38534.2 hypothetical protein PGUG_02632 [Meyerozyma guilliermondii ATCC 6260]
MPFANSYWSADYRSGIKALTVQSQQSLRQLHELRDFVARYTTHLRSNSVSQERFADVIGGIGAPFETPTGSIGSRSVSGRVFSGTRVSQGSFSEKNYISNNSEAYESEDDNKTFSKLEYDNKRTPSHSRTSSTNKSPPITIATATETYRNDFLAESRCLEILAAALDRQVLEEINSFIRVYEPVVRAAIETFEQLYDEQNQLSVSVEKLRIDYNEARRKSELGKEAPKANTVVVQEASDDEAENSESSPSPQLIASGTYLSKLSPQKLSSLVEDMIESIPSSKRSFPLPGHSNTVISSESLCAWLTKNRPCALNPTMRELEHFGQELVDAKLLVGTFLGAKKFRSKGMWFEWSDLAHYVAGDSQPSTAPSADNKRWLDTTKRFNSLVVNMSTMLGGNIDQAESQVQQRYDETYIQLQRTRHRLIEEFNHKAQTLERFEKLRIELIYQSLTRMSEAVYNSSLASSKRLHELATTFISSINKPQNYQAEFELLESNNSTGIFFPSVVAGSDPHRTTYNYFQNIKHQFNLYKDIPLQIPVEGDLLSFASLPLFLYRTTSIIEEKDDGTAKDLWHAPLDHHSYWQLKEKILSLISQYDKPDMTLDANASDRSVMEPILLVLESSSLANVINFVKNWLMEISDSVIPFMVYDGLVSSYTHERNDTLRILLTIPRSNLSSLVHLLEHICCVFGLSQIPNYSFSDTVDRDLVAPNDEDKIKQVSSTLNDMSAIGAVPFVHIILRPSLSKASSGFKPPIDIYQRLLSDLLDVDLRVQLFESLVESEKKYRTKKENTRLGLKKNRNLTPPRDELRLPELKSPHPVAADNFTLRPFRTGTTPIPSPVSSPGREIVVKKIRESHH